MIHTEVAKLCRLVKACCPSQAFDEFTVDAWALILAPWSYDDAKRAVQEIVSAPLDPGKARYIEPGHIITGIHRIRGRRLAETPMPEPPAALPVAEYQEWLRQTREAIASGADVTTVAPPLEVGRPARVGELVRSASPAMTATNHSAGETPATDGGLEAERARQLAALEAITTEEGK